MVALHPGGWAIERFQQGNHPLLKLFGDCFGVVNQITQDNQFSWLPAPAQLGNALQICSLTIAGNRNAMGLQMICFAEMDIGDQQQALLLNP